MLSRVVVTLLVICLNARCFALRSEMCTVMKRSKMTYVLTDAQRQQLTSKGYNFSQDPYNGIYSIVPNPDSKFENLKIPTYSHILFCLDGELYITAHRLFSPSGMVPYSLGVQRTYEYNAPVYPFPSFEDNQNSPEGIYSAVSTTQDKCGNLWIVDQGIKGITNGPPVFSPGLFAYSFAAQRITYKYRFPAEFFAEKGTVTTRLVIDNTFGCDKLKLIVADTLNYCLLVHDLQSKSSWKVCHPTMANDPNYSDFTYKNYTLPLPTGVYSLALTPPLGRSRIRYLLYSSYAGITTYAVPLSIVYNKRLWTQGFSIWRPYSKFGFQNRNGESKKLFNFNNNVESAQTNPKFIDVDRYFTTVGSDPTHLAQYCDVDLGRRIYFCTMPFEGAVYGWKLTEPFSHRKTIVQNKDTIFNGAILRILTSPQRENELVLSTSPIIVSLIYLIFILNCNPFTGNIFGHTEAGSEELWTLYMPCSSNIAR